jgi:hypothetical protein
VRSKAGALPRGVRCYSSASHRHTLRCLAALARPSPTCPATITRSHFPHLRCLAALARPSPTHPAAIPRSHAPLTRSPMFSRLGAPVPDLSGRHSPFTRPTPASPMFSRLGAPAPYLFSHHSRSHAMRPVSPISCRPTCSLGIYAAVTHSAICTGTYDYYRLLNSVFVEEAGGSRAIGYDRDREAESPLVL